MEQSEVLRFVITGMESLHIKYMLVGSLASTLYGEPRMTQDIDIVINLNADQVDAFCKLFPTTDYYLSQQAIQDAVRRRFQFNVLHPASGNKIDFMLSQADEWGELQLANRQRVSLLPDQLGYAARPEDIILAKLRYYQEGRSDKHLRDIKGMLKLQGSRLDREYIKKWATHYSVIEWWNHVIISHE